MVEPILEISIYVYTGIAAILIFNGHEISPNLLVYSTQSTLRPMTFLLFPHEIQGSGAGLLRGRPKNAREHIQTIS
jgi:hypothetical protein